MAAGLFSLQFHYLYML